MSSYTDEDSLDEKKKNTSNKNIRLQTIEENKSTQKTMQSKAVQVSRGYGDPIRRHRVTRRSSESSTEGGSNSRGSSLNTRTSNGQSYRRVCSKSHNNDSTTLETNRSGSLSSSTTANNKLTRKRVTSTSGSSHRVHRTSSRDTLNSHASSSEDLPNSIEIIPRRPRRIRTKDSQHSVSSSSVRASTTRNGITTTTAAASNGGTGTGTERSSHNSKRSHRSEKNGVHLGSSKGEWSKVEYCEKSYSKF